MKIDARRFAQNGVKWCGIFPVIHHKKRQIRGIKSESKRNQIPMSLFITYFLIVELCTTITQTTQNVKNYFFNLKN
jgi:hypothetical protein